MSEEAAQLSNTVLLNLGNHVEKRVTQVPKAEQCNQYQNCYLMMIKVTTWKEHAISA